MSASVTCRSWPQGEWNATSKRLNSFTSHSVLSHSNWLGIVQTGHLYILNKIHLKTYITLPKNIKDTRNVIFAHVNLSNANVTQSTCVLFWVPKICLSKSTRGKILNHVNTFLHILRNFSKTHSKTYCSSLNFWLSFLWKKKKHFYWRFFFKLDPLWWLLNYLEMRKGEEKREVEKKWLWHHPSLPIQRSLIATLLLQSQDNLSHTKPTTQWKYTKTSGSRISVTFPFPY